jgi:hypothetical protein
MTLSRMRSALAAILFVGLVGSGTELWLLEHYKEKAQLIPLVAIAATLLALGWHRLAPGRGSRRSLQVVLSVLVVAGLLGVVLHMRGNAEFQREMDPSLAGSALWWRTLRAKAPPALAPGVLAQLGLLGLVYAARPSGADTEELT